MKSWQVARALLIKGIEQPLKILCGREFQNSISDSVQALLEEQADILGVSGFYDFQRGAIYGANGTEFIFKGFARNINSLKSIEGVDICWVEEGETVSEKSWRILIPTIRKPGSQIITTFNTSQESDPTYQRMVVNPDPDSYVCKVTYLDNPFRSKELISEAESMMRLDPDAYANIWLGEPWMRSEAQVLKDKWRIGEIDTEGADGPYFGADFGFSVDPATLVKCWIKGRTLYIEKECHEVGVEVTDYPAFYRRIPESEKHRIRADCARPEIISHIKREGFNITGCKKWSGSVEDGITALRSFDEIVIHPSCKNAATEARLWSYKTDKLTGDVLPVLLDKFNHIWDAVRYAIEPIIKPTREPGIRVIE